MIDNFVRGKINYYRSGAVTGREWFEMINHSEGKSRTLRSYCEMDDIGLTRDVTCLLDEHSRPVDGFCRITQDGQLKGTALFLTEPDAVICEGVTAAMGRLSQRKAMPGGVRYLGLHPLVGDALVALARGTDRLGEFVTVHGITNSNSPNGDEGLCALPTAIDVAYLGEETVAVPAGDFLSNHFGLRWHPDWPAADLWVHGEQAMFVKLSWDMIEASYELMELHLGR